MNSPVQCTALAAGQPFAKTLAQWILEQYGDDTATLVKTLVLLPNRRACLTLREAFLECTQGKPLLLPRIQPIGDIDNEDILWASEIENLPPSISPLRRQLLLTQLVLHFEDAQLGHKHSHEQAAQLAQQLGRFIDDAAREELDFNDLSKLAPEDLQEHWQQTLDFLKLVSHHWPMILKKENAIDHSVRRHRQLLMIAEAWKKHPPGYPVIAAGSTGSQPATAALLAAIATLPEGMVVIPGLDQRMPEEEWELLSETHPQFVLKQLLDKIACPRRNVKLLAESGTNARAALLRTIFQPAEITAGWAKSSSMAEGLNNVQVLVAGTQADEARAIAIALRETLEIPGKTAALVTPDRTLARMVAAQMQRFGIAIDDSAGRPLADTPPGCFLRLAIAMVAAAAAPNELLSLLRHPLAACGRDPAECRSLSRLLEYKVLRGIRHAPGFDALIQEASDEPALVKFLTELKKHARHLSQKFEARKPISLHALIKEHITFAEWLASSDGTNGAELLWAGEAGNQLASFVSELLEHAELLHAIDPASYPGLLESLMQEEQWWPRYGAHPRLHILSPMEARMQHYDRVILGALNEGTWPALPDSDPWMSRPMRKAFGLPAPERAIGQSAHDFYLLCSAPEVILTRSRKVEGVPTVPSRWLMRLKTFIKGKDISALEQLSCDEHYKTGVTLLDAPADMAPIDPPAPVPPMEARPRQMRVTAIDTWMRDPYMIYARYILNLKPLEPLDQDPDAADFGTIVHDVLEQFAKHFPKELPEDAYAKLLEWGEAAFAKFMNRPAVASLWWPRFEAMAGWVIERETERRSQGVRVASEVDGNWQINVDGKPFTLTTRIDRLEMNEDGSVTLADYKTGTLPKDSDIEKGFANQLALEALIVTQGTLKPALLEKANVRSMEYWKLSGNTDSCEIRQVKTNLEETHARFVELIRCFDNAAEPYRAQASHTLSPRYNDYKHLTRRQEWEEV